MAQCYHRKVAWLVDGEGLFFKHPHKPCKKVTVPCGKCLPCRVNSAAQWATRALHESQYCETGCFITLTYNPEHCPSDYGLVKEDVQGFMKRLRTNIQRAKLGHIRSFFACGEYGTLKGRPHYHILIFGWCPPDLKFHGRSVGSEAEIFTSKFIERAWSDDKGVIGFCPVGTITGGSAAYVARYQKKMEKFNTHSSRPRPFFLSSRNIPLENLPNGATAQGAIGSQWCIDHHEDLRFGYVYHPEKPDVKVRIPEYYFDLLQRWYPEEYEVIKQLRYDYAMDATGGFFIVDSPYGPRLKVDTNLTDEQIQNLKEFCGRKSDEYVPLSHLIVEANDILKREEQAQLLRLSSLKRNLNSES